ARQAQGVPADTVVPAESGRLQPRAGRLRRPRGSRQPGQPRQHLRAVRRAARRLAVRPRRLPGSRQRAPGDRPDALARTGRGSGHAGGRGISRRPWLNRDRAGVIIGNTLTGEFTRASLMRLRWPYVRRVLAASLTADGWDPADQARLLAEVERSY